MRTELFAEPRLEMESKYSRYEQKFGKMCLLHEVNSEKDIESILQSQHLLSTLEREKAGLNIAGKSSERDKRTGGAAQVFTRLAVERPGDPNYRPLASGVYFVLNSALLDRDDWYGYDRDRYGLAMTQTYKREELFKVLAHSKKLYEENEIMFPGKIDLKELNGLVVAYPRFSNTVDEWAAKLPRRLIEKVSILMATFAIKSPEDEELLRAVLDDFSVSKEEQNRLFSRLPKYVLKEKTKGKIKVNYVRTWKDCVDLSHGELPKLHPAVESQLQIFSEILRLLAARRAEVGDISAKSYKSLHKLILTVANGLFTEKPEVLRGRLASLIESK
ncbi:MAG: hypothetical protein V1821_00625 [bacterium]